MSFAEKWNPLAENGRFSEYHKSCSGNAIRPSGIEQQSLGFVMIAGGRVTFLFQGFASFIHRGQRSGPDG